MPRLARLDAPGVLHHIIIRGIERKKIFSEHPIRKILSAVWPDLCLKHKPSVTPGFWWPIMPTFCFAPAPGGSPRWCEDCWPVMRSVLTTDTNATVSFFKTGTPVKYFLLKAPSPKLIGAETRCFNKNIIRFNRARQIDCLPGGCLSEGTGALYPFKSGQSPTRQRSESLEPLTDLARQHDMTVSGVGYAVQRGESIALRFNYRLLE